MAVTDYSRTPSNNNSSPPNGFPEGQSAGSVNNCMRQVMTDIVNESAANACKVLASVSGTNTITGTLTPDLAAYSAGMIIVFTPANTNTGATTLNIDSLGALAVLNTDGTACIGGELVATMPAELLLNSAANGWIIVNPNVLRSRGVEAGPIDLIQRVVTVNDTAVIGDRGRCIAYNGAGGHTQTLPSNLFTIGTILVLKNANTVNWSVAASGTLIWYNGSGAFPTGTRTLAGGAWATAHHTSATTWDFTGTGVS